MAAAAMATIPMIRPVFESSSDDVVVSTTESVVAAVSCGVDVGTVFVTAGVSAVAGWVSGALATGAWVTGVVSGMSAGVVVVV